MPDWVCAIFAAIKRVLSLLFGGNRKSFKSASKQVAHVNAPNSVVIQMAAPEEKDYGLDTKPAESLVKHTVHADYEKADEVLERWVDFDLNSIGDPRPMTSFADNPALNGGFDNVQAWYGSHIAKAQLKGEGLRLQEKNQAGTGDSVG